MVTYPQILSRYVFEIYGIYIANIVIIHVSGTYLAVTGEEEAVVVVFGLYMQNFWVHVLKHHVGPVSYIWNVASISVQ